MLLALWWGVTIYLNKKKTNEEINMITSVPKMCLYMGSLSTRLLLPLSFIYKLVIRLYEKMEWFAINIFCMQLIL